MRRRSLAITLITALALTVLPAAAPAAERTVSVEATATIRVPNDSASVGLSVSLERSTRGGALRAVSAQLRGVIAAVGSIPGVGAGDVRTGRISIDKRTRGRKTLFRASEGVGVTLHEPARAGDLVSAAIAAGATGVRGPTYFVGDTEAAYAKGLAAAFEKAKVKAAALAAQAGAALGPALTISEGGNAEIIPFEDKAAAAPVCGTGAVGKLAAGDCASSPPTKPGASSVTATVGVVFSLL
ncbi:MAG TPA: SIMPL domain-containing protein [Solirubrobacterales bacterium]|nr:SIMPL domain-containing protein [Solirubrobacterales bacterium]